MLTKDDTNSYYFIGTVDNVKLQKLGNINYFIARVVYLEEPVNGLIGIQAYIPI